jgi:TonB family protein
VRTKKAASLLIVSWIVVLLCAPGSTADDKVAQQLKSDYLNKVVTLRHFYNGEHLSFPVDGSLSGTAEIGPWTVAGQVLVKSIELHAHSLEIQGRRVFLVFDAKGKPYRDVLDMLDESRSEDRDKLKDYFLSKDVAIDIVLASENPDAQEISAALTAVFLKPGEPVTDIVPEYWRDYFDQIEGQPHSVPHSRETVYKVKAGEVFPPRVISQPEPEFSEYARAAKFQGSVTLSLVVDALGQTTDTQIISPLGLGLDEKAVDALRGWRFEPARKDGKPVPVKIMIQTEFHLY